MVRRVSARGLHISVCVDVCALSELGMRVCARSAPGRYNGGKSSI